MSTTPLPTNPSLDMREAERFPCPDATKVRVLPRASFQPLEARVRDVSSKGVGLVCRAPSVVGQQLAFQWHFGAPNQWQTLLAYVARIDRLPDGDYLVGCVFERRLAEEEVRQLLPEPAAEAAAGSSWSLLRPFRVLAACLNS